MTNLWDSLAQFNENFEFMKINFLKDEKSNKNFTNNQVLAVN